MESPGDPDARLADADLVVLSPHLDDAVLSVGGSLHRRAAQGQDVVVLTLFAGAGEAPTPLSEQVLGWMGLGADAIERRREEDRAACARVGATAVHWDLVDAVARRDAGGDPVIHEVAGLFGPVPGGDELLIEDLARRLRDHLDGARVLCPLAVGGHVDHRITRQAAARAWPAGVAHYQDFPYSARRGALAAAVPDAASWSVQAGQLGPADVEARCQGILAYVSQVRPLFGNERRLRRAVRRDLRRHGGEPVWRRPSPAG